ncbi:MAG TPA: UDP-N-acetylmuramoyl-L-alanyl-D-glutamate--2,6-diaminopimelate ligase, partial [Thermoanaerobaculia bacterium]|nr:UDP-N-acetylmuramoyl-L-alanyl-D-glutamate--2,6-diaminopimelate ligase [Thermoanaerobaculia bacterium]
CPAGARAVFRRAGVRLTRLLEGLAVRFAEGSPDPEVTGVSHDSRQVTPGDLFVAWKGGRFDGTLFAPGAAEEGAVALLVPSGSLRPAVLPAKVAWVTADDPHALLPHLAARAYGEPQRDLLMAGVTGTNGKSTVSTLIARLIETAGRPCGLIGSLGFFFGDHKYAKGRTTPEGSDFFRLLARMRDDGAQAVAMEVSSHALSLGRIAGTTFDVAVFTNLSRDHFDFYRDFEDYYQAKRKLFEMLEPEARAAVNRDDPWGARLAGELADPITFGEREGDVHPLDVVLDDRGIRGTLATPRGKLDFDSQLIGNFNLLNLLAAVAAVECLELPHGAVADGLARQRPLIGRMEPVVRGQPFPVFIDYSHTDQALTAALTSLRQLSDRRLIVVFGCGGDRDQGKRPLMGRVAGELADVPILTSDNPRTEDPLKIIAEVETGVKESGNTAYRVVVDRRDAIRLGVDLADERSALLIAGKGDEPIQVIGDEEHPFYDFDEAVAALEERFGAG